MVTLGWHKMQFFPAIVSRRFSWRLMILGACLGCLIGPIVIGWRAYPWVAVPFVFGAFVILHPVMDKDLPNLIGVDTPKSPRTYIAVALFAAAQIVSDRFFHGRCHLRSTHAEERVFPVNMGR